MRMPSPLVANGPHISCDRLSRKTRGVVGTGQWSATPHLQIKGGGRYEDSGSYWEFVGPVGLGACYLSFVLPYMAKG